MTTYDDVTNIFESLFADKVALSDVIVNNWFNMARGEYALSLSSLPYNTLLKRFDDELDMEQIILLAYIMKKYYQQRTVSLTNKRNNIVTKDISLNSTDSSKSHMETELQEIKDQIDFYIRRLQTAGYN